MSVRTFFVCLHRPHYKKYLTDSQSPEVPVEYLEALEKGQREYAKSDPAAFGTHANFNFHEYTKVEMWRKREAYIGVSRYVLGKKNYAKYVNYNWSDYRLRMKLCKTFKVRHLAYTDGTKTLRGLVDPKHWAKNEGKNCRRRLRATITFEKKDDDGGVVEESGSDQDMVWDSEEEEWVPAEK